MSGFGKSQNLQAIENLEQYVIRHTEDGVPYCGTDCEQLDDEIISLAKEYGVEEQR